MTKYVLKKKGCGKYGFWSPTIITNQEAKEREKNGEEIYDSRREAVEEAQEKNRE